MLHYCTLYGTCTVKYTKAQPLIDAHMWKRMPDTWTNLSDWTCECTWASLEAQTSKFMYRGITVFTMCCAVPFSWYLVQFCSVTQSCPTLWDPMDRSTPGFPVHHQLLEFTQTHVHRVSDAIQPSHPLSSPSPALNLSQNQGLFQWVSSLHQVAKVLEFQLQHQSFQWTPRTDLL